VPQEEEKDMNLREAAQRALKAMEDGEYRADMVEFSDALIALRAALAEPDQEPVAWRYRGNLHEFDPSGWAEGPVTPLYTAPTPRKPLTELEYALDALRQMVEGMEQASAGERIDFQGYAMGGRSVLEKIEGVE